jgi:hypothetical protein
MLGREEGVGVRLAGALGCGASRSVRVCVRWHARAERGGIVSDKAIYQQLTRRQPRLVFHMSCLIPVGCACNTQG